jgi:hypothetical protein
MNQFGIQSIYTWKRYNETPCIDILNKQKCLFFKNREQEGKTGPVWRLVPVGGGGYKERTKEAECSGNILYSCMKMEQ